MFFFKPESIRRIHKIGWNTRYKINQAKAEYIESSNKESKLRKRLECDSPWKEDNLSKVPIKSVVTNNVFLYCKYIFSDLAYFRTKAFNCFSTFYCNNLSDQLKLNYLLLFSLLQPGTNTLSLESSRTDMTAPFLRILTTWTRVKLNLKFAT